MDSSQGEIVANYIYNKPAIGKGSFSKVYLGKHILTGEPVCVKKISKKNLTGEVIARLKREINILRLCTHRNIIKFIDSISTANYIYIITEYCTQGTLKLWIDERDDILEEEGLKCMFQIKEALRYLYCKNIFHRDIKPQNILVHKEDNEFIIKLADFGLAKQFSTEDLQATLCGTPMYMAPEIIQGKDAHERSDLWSVGIIMYQLLFHSYPFGIPKNILHIKSELSDVNIETLPEYTSIEAGDLLSLLLKVNPEERISWEEFFSHPWFDQLQDLNNSSISSIGNDQYSVVSHLRGIMLRRENEQKESLEEEKAVRMWASLPLIENYYLRDDYERLQMRNTTREYHTRDPLTIISNGYTQFKRTLQTIKTWTQSY